MPGVTLGQILAALGQHHGEADPTLLQWIMQALSHILVGTLGFTELTIVIIIGMVILAMPALIVIAYWVSSRRGAHPGTPAGAPAEGVAQQLPHRE